jgi:hypothetical protein
MTTILAPTARSAAETQDSLRGLIRTILKNHGGPITLPALFDALLENGEGNRGGTLYVPIPQDLRDVIWFMKRDQEIDFTVSNEVYALKLPGTPDHGEKTWTLWHEFICDYCLETTALERSEDGYPSFCRHCKVVVCAQCGSRLKGQKPPFCPSCGTLSPACASRFFRSGNTSTVYMEHNWFQRNRSTTVPDTLPFTLQSGYSPCGTYLSAWLAQEVHLDNGGVSSRQIRELTPEEQIAVYGEVMRKELPPDKHFKRVCAEAAAKLDAEHISGQHKDVPPCATSSETKTS